MLCYQLSGVCMYVYIIIYIYERPHENESMRRACPGMCAHLFASLCVFGGDACISGVYVYAHAYIMYIRIHIVKSIYMCIWTGTFSEHTRWQGIMFTNILACRISCDSPFRFCTCSSTLTRTKQIILFTSCSVLAWTTYRSTNTYTHMLIETCNYTILLVITCKLHARH